MHALSPLAALPPVTARPLRIVVAGHVDHGKSTLIGRLLHDTGSLPEGKLAELEAASESRGMPLEWSFALDSFQAERDQAVTIDTTQIRCRTRRRELIIIDAPGHREFLKNMISGAAEADAAVLVVDAELGMQEQTRRHAYLLHLLGLRQVAVAVNKMDVVGFAQARFAEVAETVTQYLGGIGLNPAAIVPLSARHGDNLATPSPNTPWYDGAPLLDALDGFDAAVPAVERPLRLPIQDIYKFDERRILVGRIETGSLRVGDTLVFSPSGQSARVRRIEAWGTAALPVEAQAGQSVGITLDQPIFVERGDIASHAEAAPTLTTLFRATVFWLGARPLTIGGGYKMKLATAEVPVTVQSIERIIDTDTLQAVRGETVPRLAVAEVMLRGRALLALDEHHASPATGRFVLVDGFDTVGGGIVSMEGLADQHRATPSRSTDVHAVEHLLTAEARAWRNGHRGTVVWFTGLSGAGKSTLAMRVEQRLFAKGYQVYVLDGDNVRRGLNADLGFAPADRAENIRRIGAVAALMADAGTIAITAFISPYRADRERARAAADGAFHEVYIKADLATCEARDPKGLYHKARRQEIAEFTGVAAPYEAPEHPDLVVDTAALPVGDCVDAIVAYIERQVALPRAQAANS